MSFLSVYKNFLNSLELISQTHDELTDTDVRERLHEVINWYLIWGNPIDKSFPQRYSMFSLDADKHVSEATITFIAEASPLLVDTPVGQARNDLIENSEVETDAGSPYYFFIGSIDEVLPPIPPASDDIYNDD